MLVGSPPFNTTSLLHLISLIRNESIKWPENISQNCQSLLKGLLNKDPTQRLSWPHLLEHPFVKGSILIIGDKSKKSLFSFYLFSFTPFIIIIIINFYFDHSCDYATYS